MTPARDDDRYLGLHELADYSSLSQRTLRRALADPVHPLPAHRVGTRVLIKRSAFDTWLREQDAGAAAPVDANVDAWVRRLTTKR